MGLNKWIVKIKKRLFHYDERKAEWKRRNPHNDTTISGISVEQMDIVSVGNNSYGTIRVCPFSGENRLKIGNYVSIADATFMLGGEHKTDMISTYPFFRLLEPEEAKSADSTFSRGDIIVEDDVWLGSNCIIRSGVRIGQGAVVGTGALVTKDVPPYAIVAGVPAKIIRMRFDELTIEKLKKKDYGKLTKEMIKEHYKELTSRVTTTTDLDWFPEKSK